MGPAEVAKMCNEYGEWDIGNQITALLEQDRTEEAIKLILKGLTKKQIDKDGLVSELEVILDEMELPTNIADM